MKDLTTQPTAQLSLLQLPDLVAVDEFDCLAVSKTTVTWFRQCAHRLYRYLGDVDVAEVTPRDIRGWLDVLASENLKPVTINGYLRGLRTMYSRLMRRGLVDHNPAASVRFVPTPRPTPKAVRLTDYRRLVDAANTNRDRAILGVLWASGCRLAGLTSMDVTRFEAWQEAGGNWRYALYVVEKFSQPRYVYVGGREAAWLRLWLDERPNVKQTAIFLTEPSPHKPLTEIGVQRLLTRLAQRARVEGRANAHAFRHAFAIRKLNEGYDLATVSQWLGHSSPMFTASVYAIRSEAELRSRYFAAPIKA